VPLRHGGGDDGGALLLSVAVVVAVAVAVAVVDGVYTGRCKTSRRGNRHRRLQNAFCRLTRKYVVVET